MKIWDTPTEREAYIMSQDELVKRYSLDIPASLWKDLEKAIPKDMTFRDFALEALREKVEKDKETKL
jgi:hypothetical protein